ncbi:MAG: hypothetical protein HRT38_02685 [Alteromonadaceae bacterium]|nr:hypothetical protein [Alteromonadaceae bacterium]
MAWELISKFGASGWLEVGSGISLRPLTAVQAATKTVNSLMTTTESLYPILDAKLTITSSTPTKNMTVDLFIRPNADTESPGPSGAYEPYELGSFVLDSVANSTYYLFEIRNLDDKATFYLKSNESTTVLVATLSIRMRSVVSAG